MIPSADRYARAKEACETQKLAAVRPNREGGLYAAFLDVFEGGKLVMTVPLNAGAVKVLYLKLGDILLGDTH